MSGELWCAGCQERHTASEFGISRTRSTGKQPMCRAALAKENKRYRTLEKAKVVSHYSKGLLCCAKCGFTDMRALTIDHVDAGGSEERKTTGFGSNFYRWLVLNDFPAGYQVLCMNCQFIKRHENNECPGNGEFRHV